ncbi:substrate-binding domain-containing protein [Ahniella affigens]|uniref:substrate-binding domain-containing protein n=1 Tax=Ahniella affigens TaxID=2021234 RepID=UPI0014763072|nr:substrate-binding domain-containing protein [Ahniella affigens]
MAASSSSVEQGLGAHVRRALMQRSNAMIQFQRIMAFCCALLLAVSGFGAKAQQVATDAAARRALGDLAVTAYASDGGGKLALGDYATIAALDRVLKGESDAALVARGVHTLRATELELTFTPLVWDGLVLITHLKNPVRNIGLRQLRDVYAGKIKNWKELGGTDAPINLYSVAGPLDGVEYELRRALYGYGHVPIAAGRWYLNTGSLEAAVALDANAIAVSSLSNAFANKQIKMLNLEGVVPSRVAVRRGEYLLAMPIYLVSRTVPENPHAARLQRLISAESLTRSLHARKLTPIRDASLLTKVFDHRREQLLAILAVPPEQPLSPDLLAPQEIEPRPGTETAVSGNNASMAPAAPETEIDAPASTRH